MHVEKNFVNGSKRSDCLLISLIAIPALFLLFWNLGNQYLWQDEAQTALIGKTILNHGLPKAFDGKNFFSQENGADYGWNYIWKWHNWLQFYLVAASFKLFGVSTYTSRLPFAITGLGSLLLTYLFANTLFKSRRTAFLAVLLLLISVPFLILTKQCRYYSPAIFFSVLGLYGYLRILYDKKDGIMLYLLSMMFLFHSHFIYFGTFFMTILTHSLLCHRSKLKKVAVYSAAAFLINAPWIAWQSTLKYSENYEIVRGFINALMLGKTYVSAIFSHVTSPFIFILPLISGCMQWYRERVFFSRDSLMWRNLLLLGLFTFFNILAISIFSPGYFFRYMAPLIPVIIIMVALIVSSLMKLSRIAGITVLVFLALTGTLKDYIYEITHDYDGPVEGIVKYLNKNGTEYDTVLITYGDLPLKFYTNMRVVGGATGEDISDVKDVDWVIFRKHNISRGSLTIAQQVINNKHFSNYKRVVIDYPDIPFENREDPAEHNYRTVTDADNVIIFQEIKRR